MKKQWSVFRNVLQSKSVFVLAAMVVWVGLTARQAFAATEPEPCSANSQSRQLDYWLGDWVVTNPGAPGSSTSKVYLSQDKCVFVESWDSGKGHKGENLFAYSADDKSWRGMFVDNRGHVHVFVDGKISGNSAEFYGPSRGAKGESILNRIKIVRVNADRVDQTWEKSTDNGSTWATVFRGEYSRKKQ